MPRAHYKPALITRLCLFDWSSIRGNSIGVTHLWCAAPVSGAAPIRTVNRGRDLWKPAVHGCTFYSLASRQHMSFDGTLAPFRTHISLDALPVLKKVARQEAVDDPCLTCLWIKTVPDCVPQRRPEVLLQDEEDSVRAATIPQLE